MADRTLPPKLVETLELLALLPGRDDRIQFLIDVAERFRDVPPEIAERPFPEEARVPACESEAFVFSEELPDGTLRYHFAVENPQGISAKCLAVILDESLSGVDPAEVARVPDDVIYDVFGKELSMGKSMGLMGMVHMATAAARRRQSGNEPPQSRV